MILEKHRNEMDQENSSRTNSYYSMTEFDETSENSEILDLKNKEHAKIEVKDLKKT